MSSPWAETLASTEHFRPVDLAPQEALVGYLAREDRCVAQLLVAQGEHIPVTTPDGLVARMSNAQISDRAVGFKAGMTSQSLADNHLRAGSLQLVDGSSEYPRAVYKPADMESDIADATAGHLLAIARDFGSLQAIFGTNRGGLGQSRSSLTLLELADFISSDEVAAGQDFTLQEVAERSGVEYHNLLRHMERLSKLGIIEYDAVMLPEVVATFTIVPGIDPLVSTRIIGGEERKGVKTTHAGELTYRSEIGLIVARLQAEQRTSFTYDDIIAEIDRPGEVTADDLKNAVSQMISEGILERQHPTTAEGDVFSHVIITDDTKRLMQRLSRMHHGLGARHIAEEPEDETGQLEGELLPPQVDQEVLEEGLQYAQEIMSNPATVARLLRQSRDNSMQAKIGSFAQWSGIAIRALINTPEGELTTEEMWQTHFGPDSLSTAGLRAVLNAMVDAGILIKHKKGLRRVWTLTN